MSRPIAWGIVGTGGIARQFAADLALLPDASLIGICSRDLEKAKAFQAEFRAERPYSDLDAMLADPGIDVIYIATPNALHAEQALRAIAPERRCSSKSLWRHPSPTPSALAGKQPAKNAS